MGAILDDIVKDLKGLEVDQQVKDICDKIWEEEQGDMDHLDLRPDGPNIFLALNCPGRTKDEVAFLTLERELEGEYVAGFWAINIKRKEDVIKRYKTWSIKEANCIRIIKAYAKKLKYYKGILK